MRVSKTSNLREPLYKSPPGSPELLHDPGVEEYISRTSREKSGYLPPYRYDKEEQIQNIYRTSPEAYSNVAKLLIYEYECCKHEYNPHQVVKKNLTPTQRKFFADAHMERGLSLPTESNMTDAPISKLVRRIDSHFGMILIEYYASMDGNLIPSQEESLHRLFNSYCDGMTTPTASNIDAQLIVNTPTTPRPPDDSINDAVESRAVGVQVTPVNEPENLSNGDQFHPNSTSRDQPNHDSSFERLYNEASVYPSGSIDTGMTTTSGMSETTETATFRSKLRQELLKEIMQVTKLLRREQDLRQKKGYEKHLDILRFKFNQCIEKMEASSNQKIKKKSTLLLGAQNRIGPSEKIIVKAFQDIPSEKVTKVGMEVVSESNKSSQESSAKKVEVRVVDNSQLEFINIVAPAKMSEGYMFEAKHNNKKFLAKVPKGGVRKGQSFKTPMLNPSGASRRVVVYESAFESMRVPKGAWRDSFFDCFQDPMCLMSFTFPHGKQNVTLLNSFCCAIALCLTSSSCSCHLHVVALSQIRSRLQLKTKGKIFSPYGAKFLIFFSLAVVSLNAWTAVALFYIVNSPQLWLILTCTVPLGMLDMYLVGTFIVSTIDTRKAVVAHYDIEEQKSDVSRNVALGMFCSCCSISQMGRHTADYGTYRENILSPTGLPRQLEMIVPKHTYSENEDNVRSRNSF